MLFYLIMLGQEEGCGLKTAWRGCKTAYRGNRPKSAPKMAENELIGLVLRRDVYLRRPLRSKTILLSTLGSADHKCRTEG